MRRTLLVLGLLVIVAGVAGAQSGCVLGCPEPPVRSAPDWLIALGLGVLQVWALFRYGGGSWR